MNELREMKSFKEMERKVNEYFALCEEKNIFPDEAGLIVYLGISELMYQAYLTKDKKRYIPYRLCLENARLRRESILVRGIFAADSRTLNGKLFLVRQAENGGLSEETASAKPEKKILDVRFGTGAEQFFD